MKKKVGIAAVTLLVLVSVFGAGLIAGAASAQAGSAGDPLITLSYLEKRLAEAGNGYSAVNVSKGDELITECGTELILYSGSGTCLGSRGLIDVTGGQLYKNGNSLSLYHAYISPADGSGFACSADAKLLIKGVYSVR